MSIRAKPMKSLGRKQRLEVRKIAKSAVKNLAERKSYFESVDQIDGSYDNPLVRCINDVQQGDNDNQRVGDNLRMTSLMLRCGVDFQNSATTTGRLVVLMWKPGDQDLDASTTAGYTTASFLQGSGTQYDPYEHYRVDTRARFQVLWDKVITASDIKDGSGGSNTRLHFNKMIPLKDKLVQYDSTSARITKNAIYVFWLSNVSDASGSEPKLTIRSRLNYIDL